VTIKIVEWNTIKVPIQLLGVYEYFVAPRVPLETTTADGFPVLLL